MSDQAALFPDPPKPKPKAPGPGPVYQGVSKAIRYLETLPDQDPAWATRWAGTIAQARSLAGSIDRASGRDPERRQAAGRDLANLHEQLDALMLRLDPQGVAAEGPSGWDQLQEELAQLELDQRRRVMEGQDQP